MLETTVFHSRGNIELLSQTKLALFSSRNTPPEIYSSAQNLFRALLRLPISLASGWQSPLEKKLLKLFQPSVTANLIQYFARELNEINLTEWQKSLVNHNKLLMIAPETTCKRPTQQLVRKRDALLFSHCSKVLFFFIKPGGRLASYWQQLEQGGHALFLLDHPLNQRFTSSNVVLLNEENLEVILAAGPK